MVSEIPEVSSSPMGGKMGVDKPLAQSHIDQIGKLIEAGSESLASEMILEIYRTVKQEYMTPQQAAELSGHSAALFKTKFKGMVRISKDILEKAAGALGALLLKIKNDPKLANLEQDFSDYREKAQEFIRIAEFFASWQAKIALRETILDVISYRLGVLFSDRMETDLKTHFDAIYRSWKKLEGTPRRDAHIMRVFSYLLLSVGNLKEAERLLKQAQKRENPQANYLLKATILVEEGRKDEASNVLHYEGANIRNTFIIEAKLDGKYEVVIPFFKELQRMTTEEDLNLYLGEIIQELEIWVKAKGMVKGRQSKEKEKDIRPDGSNPGPGSSASPVRERRKMEERREKQEVNPTPVILTLSGSEGEESQQVFTLEQPSRSFDPVGSQDDTVMTQDTRRNGLNTSSPMSDSKRISKLERPDEKRAKPIIERFKAVQDELIILC